MLRGARATVAGDRHELPPTTFFAAGEDEEAEGPDDAPLSPTEGFESLLDLMSAFLDTWSLEWHYRSRDEALIAFANRHVYANSLVTFPASGERGAVSHVLVPPREEPRDGEEDSPAAEVQRVVDLVLEHAARRPNETLGVIALGIRHARRVEAAVEAAAGARPELDALPRDPDAGAPGESQGAAAAVRSGRACPRRCRAQSG